MRILCMYLIPDFGIFIQKYKLIQYMIKLSYLCMFYTYNNIGCIIEINLTRKIQSNTQVKMYVPQIRFTLNNSLLRKKVKNLFYYYKF